MKKIFSAELWASSALLSAYFETTKATAGSDPSVEKKKQKQLNFHSLH